MSKWKKIMQDGLFSRVTAECYNKRFPVYIRAKLADWLECQERWILSIDPDNPSNHSRMYQFLGEMLHEIERVPISLPLVNINNQDSIMHRHIVEEAYKKFSGTLRSNTKHSLCGLFNDIRESLKEENKMLNNTVKLPICHGSNFTNVSEKEQFLRLDKELISRLAQVTESFEEMNIKLAEISALYETLKEKELAIEDTAQIRLQQIKAALNILCLHVSEQFNLTIMDIFVQAKNELQSFQKEQLYVSVGKKQIRDLVKIDGWFEGISKCLAFLAHFLLPLAHLCQLLNSDLHQTVTTLQKEVEQMKEDMINLCFIIENQPNPVVCNNVDLNSPIKLRLLKCSANMSTRPGNLSLLNEKMRQDPAYQPDKPIGKVGYRSTRPPTVTSNMIEYKNVKITGLNVSSDVALKNVVNEEKVYIQFQCSVNVDEKTYELSTISLPLALTSNPTEEGIAWAKILWRNAFDTMRNHENAAPGKPGMDPIGRNVTWSALIEWIDFMFQKLGKGLTDRNKEYLKKKLFRGSVPSHEMVSWQLFTEDTLVEVLPELLDDWKENEKTQKQVHSVTRATKSLLVPFTFWEWLWACLELLKQKPRDPKYCNESLQILWELNEIVGFMAEDEIKHLLSNAEYSGTFIIRFPEGRPKSIGVYVFDANDILRKFTYTRKDLDKQTLHQMIMLNPLLRYLYPNVEKRNVFSKPRRQQDHWMPFSSLFSS